MASTVVKDGIPSSTVKNVPFQFQVLKTEIDSLVRKAIYGKDINPLVHKYHSVVNPNCENDVKTTVDQAFREILYEAIVKGPENRKLEQIIQQSIEAAEKDACSGSLPLLLFSDMFDSLTLDKCEELFSLVEDRVDIWKRDFFFKHCKNQLLRSCNDLLRRLSRSQNTVFCGRILVFLARFFPLSERSGLNIVSEFNLDNVTIYSTKDDELSSEKDEPMEEGEMREIENNISVDYNLYRKFWSLQEFFRQPFLCYNKVNWKHFSSYSSNVLAAFSSFKLDEMKSTKWKLPTTKSVDEDEGKPVYFAKYLTSQKLLELEFSDSNFRRYLLIQFLILFQYLQSNIKFKQETHLLTDDQTKWVKETTDLIYKLLKETPPDGTKFAKNVEHILSREEYWNNWKNDGCPDFKRAGEDTGKNSAKPNRVKQKLGDELRGAAANKKILLGNNEMNRLWNLCPDNWEACRSQKRDFMPSLESYFDTAIGRNDPARQAESKEKLINDGQFAWRALRLLSHKSPHFFTQSNQPIVPLPKYLENMVNKLAKELPQNQAQSDFHIKQEPGADEDSDDELLRNNEEVSEARQDVADVSEEMADLKDVALDGISKELLSQVAEEIKGNWKLLAPKLIFQEDEILYFASETNDVVEQGRKMLMVWREQEPENATCSALKIAIEKAGIPKLKCL